MDGAVQLLGTARERSGRYTLPARARDEAFVIWSAARAEANLAYDWWCAAPGADAYAVFRAAEDRADAAEHALTGF